MQLQKIVHAVQSSPQWHHVWLAAVTISLRQMENALQKMKLMLIIDVKTWWSSMHQMLHKQSCLVPILQSLASLHFRTDTWYCDVIDNCVAKNCNLHTYELSTADWDTITLVTQWLKSFKSATTQMSATKSSMLSSTHAIFHCSSGSEGSEAVGDVWCSLSSQQFGFL